MKINSLTHAVILDILSYGETTGAELGRLVGQRKMLQVPPGSLYETLNRMEKRGWVSSRKTPTERLISISKLGARELGWFKQAINHQD
jgi:DNA-binding PadR family transcriptional regulator